MTTSETTEQIHEPLSNRPLSLEERLAAIKLLASDEVNFSVVDATRHRDQLAAEVLSYAASFPDDDDALDDILATIQLLDRFIQ